MQDFIPVLGFVLAYVVSRWIGYTEQAIYIATAALMLVSLLQILYFFVAKKPIEKRHWLTVLVIWVLGSITLLLHNDLFIKLKPTILNTIIAFVFLGSQFIGKDNLTKKMLHSAFDMPDRLWVRLNIAWVLFFLLEGGLNIFVALRFSNDVYVSFKFWGLMVLTFVFLAIQFFLLRRYLRKEDNHAS